MFFNKKNKNKNRVGEWTTGQDSQKVNVTHTQKKVRIYLDQKEIKRIKRHNYYTQDVDFDGILTCYNSGILWAVGEI